jgi:hypothetical protein
MTGVLALRDRVESEQIAAIDRALISGGLSLACTAAALVIAWRMQASERRFDLRSLFLVVLIVAPSVGAVPVVAPLIDRATVAEPPVWVAKAIAPTELTVTDGASSAANRGPLRVFRPLMSFDGAKPIRDRQTLADAIATLAGTSAAKWGLGAARSDDPARPPIHDRIWLAAASAGGQLLDRYGIALAILPGSMIGGRNLAQVATRSDLALFRYPASPSAALVYEWLFVDDVDTAIARLFPPGAGRGLGSGLVVLHGRGSENQDEPGVAQPCTIERWSGNAIDLLCAATGPAYAVVSSTAAAGWSVSIDGRATPWLVADVMRRAVAVAAGDHRIAWRYHARGLAVALVLAALGVLVLVALFVLYGRHPDDRDQPPDPDRSDVN